MIASFFSGGNEDFSFAVDGDKGLVSVAKQLDAETRHNYNLTLSVTDGVHIVTGQVSNYIPLFLSGKQIN